MIKIKRRSIHPVQVHGNCDYLFLTTQVKTRYLVTDNIDCTIFCKSGQFEIGDHQHFVNPGDTIRFRGFPATLNGAGELYVAQVSLEPAAARPPICEITRDGAHKKVTKPWGYELWLNGEHPLYSVKRIFIKAGFQTSLQYHNVKEETNLIESGEARLVNQTNLATAVDDVEHVTETRLFGPISVHIPPKTLHRIRAVTDIFLFEVSTPHLDDVIRLQDDSNRGNGRIESEHQ